MVGPSCDEPRPNLVETPITPDYVRIKSPGGAMPPTTGKPHVLPPRRRPRPAPQPVQGPDGAAPDRLDFDFDADGYSEPTDAFIDGIVFDGRKPNAYIDTLPIGLKGDQTTADAVTN